MICHLLNFDYKYNNERLIYIARSLTRNIVSKSKKVKKLIDKVKDIDEKVIIIFIHQMKVMYIVKKINLIFKYIEDNMDSNCYPENQY